MRNYLIILLSVLIIASSCNTGKKISTQNQAITNTKWSLDSFTDNGTATKVTGQRAFMRLDESKQSIGGNGSCNNFGGSYTLSGDKLTVSKIFSTKMYCEAVQKTEDHFLRLLETVTRYNINGNTLLLYNNDQLVLQFSAVKE